MNSQKFIRRSISKFRSKWRQITPPFLIMMVIMICSGFVMPLTTLVNKTTLELDLGGAGLSLLLGFALYSFVSVFGYLFTNSVMLAAARAAEKISLDQHFQIVVSRWKQLIGLWLAYIAYFGFFFLVAIQFEFMLMSDQNSYSSGSSVLPLLMFLAYVSIAYVMVRLSPFMLVLVDNRLSFVGIVRRSWSLTKGYFWFIVWQNIKLFASLYGVLILFMIAIMLSFIIFPVFGFLMILALMVFMVICIMLSFLVHADIYLALTGEGGGVGVAGSAGSPEDATPLASASARVGSTSAHDDSVADGSDSEKSASDVIVTPPTDDAPKTFGDKKPAKKQGLDKDER